MYGLAGSTFVQGPRRAMAWLAVTAGVWADPGASEGPCVGAREAPWSLTACPASQLGDLWAAPGLFLSVCGELMLLTV